ncbi:phosphomannomutase [Rheinheimera sediminis]|uniref:phosphomannomutase n=1 Tax=Rheinheimera sp. YQF-1 TaxID=2499626 RepID=UPI000FD8CA5A|nr:phosphomannomutase [Rheinheimera sp. YQF-1]RVT46025.1 phosphomannomutase [Rheinheimera sp. YQF-1]
MWSTDCFKTYDIRGIVPTQLNEGLAYRIGRALCQQLSPKTVVIGHDIRLSSPSLSAALARGLQDGGADVIDIGLCGTEQVYFSVFHLDADAGICVTASHNPANYNGMKFVGKGSAPISADTGLNAIRDLVASAEFLAPATKAGYQQQNTLPAYVEHLLTYLDVKALKPLKVVMNPGNGGAGLVVNALAPLLPIEIVPLQFDPDGTFPHGVPNPLLVENRLSTSAAITACHADLGVAWDGDFDRCFFFDEQGQFVDGYYLVSLLAKALLLKHPGEKIIHDPRLYWATQHTVKAAGGVPVISKTGHAYIKEKMRAEDALYGGEISAHHYFRDFAYCDNGTIPWLLMLALLSATAQPLSALVEQLQQQFPCSDELNFKVTDAKAAIAAIAALYQPQASEVDLLDGLGLSFADWRFNLRMSNTEPLLRLNVETRANTNLLARKIAEITSALQPFLA